MRGPLLELERVSKRFGPVQALREVSFTVAQGEFVTFLGPSGCGKTTCLRLISGFETPSTGTIRLDGHDITLTPPYRRDVNQVFQSYALFPHLDVFENIAFGLRMKKLPASEIRSRVQAALDMAGLPDMARRRPWQLSGGQRQRVALARAIVCQPKVLLLDEPLSALDAKLRSQMRSELQSLQRRLGTTFILVTHDQEEALALSDRVLVMNSGAIEQIGTPSEIYHHPRTRFVAEFIGESNFLPARLIESRHDFTLYQLPNGTLLKAATPPPTEALSPAGEALLCLRCEHVQLHDAGTTPDNRHDNLLPARCENTIFRGALQEIQTTLPGGPEIRIRALLPAASVPPACQPGSPLLLRIPPAALNPLAHRPNSC